jgi:hypothetical protein
MREIPVTPTKWTSNIELVQVLWEMGMQHVMFQIEYTSLDDQRFTTKMKDMLIALAPEGSFGTLAALLMPYVDHSIYDVTQAMLAWVIWR